MTWISSVRLRILRATLTVVVAVSWGCARGDDQDRFERNAERGKPAILLVADSLTDEGVAGRVVAGAPPAGTAPSDSLPVPFFRDSVLYADPRLVVEVLGAGTQAKIRAGRLVLDGELTELEVEAFGEEWVAPVDSVARRFGAYLHAEPVSGTGTLWPSGALCALAERGLSPQGSLGSRVFLGAARAGLFKGCVLPVPVRVRDLPDASPEERWEANLEFDTLVADSLALAVLRDHDAVPYAAFGWTRWEHRVGVAPAAASESVLSALREGAIRRARGILCDPRAVLGEPPVVADGGVPEGRRRALQARGEVERMLLADLTEALRMLDSLPAREPLVYAMRVVAPASELRRLAEDPRVRALEPAVRVNGVPVLPEVYVPPSVQAPTLPRELELLPPEEVRARTRALSEAAGCPTSTPAVPASP